MYEIDYKLIKKGISFHGIFLLMGLLFLVIFGYAFFGGVIKRFTMDSQVVAKNIDENRLESNYSPIYTYYVKGNSYTCRSQLSSSTRKIGLRVFYNSKNPSDCVTEFDTRIDFSIVFLIIPLLFIYVGSKNIILIKKRLKRLKLLEIRGRLIKNLSYKMIKSGMNANGKDILNIEVNYKLPSGSEIILTGDPRFDYKFTDNDGLVDLLIDPMDVSNYYLDFDIKIKKESK